MTPRLRLVAVALALLLPGGFLLDWILAVGRPQRVADFTVPSAVGPWRAVRDEPLDPRILAELGTTSHVSRLYRAAEKTPIGVYVGFYAGRAGLVHSPHDPEACYPTHGWETVATRSLEVAVSESQRLRARLLDARLGASREIVLHWSQPAARWPEREAVEQLLLVADALAGRPQYAFVRLAAVVASASAVEKVERDLIEFAAEFAWPIRRTLSGDSGPRSARLRLAPLPGSDSRSRRDFSAALRAG